MATRSSEFLVTRYESGNSAERDDRVAREEPLEIRVEGHSVAIVMRTPGHDEELTAGFLLSEGIVAERADLFEISQCPSQPGQNGNVIDVLLKDASKLDMEKLSRNVFTSSSCGICGKATIESCIPTVPTDRERLFSVRCCALRVSKKEPGGATDLR